MIIQLADYSIDRKFISNFCKHSSSHFSSKLKPNILLQTLKHEYLLLFFVSHDSEFIIVELLAGHNKQFQYDNMWSWTFLFFKF